MRTDKALHAKHPALLEVPKKKFSLQGTSTYYPLPEKASGGLSLSVMPSFCFPPPSMPCKCVTCLLYICQGLKSHSAPGSTCLRHKSLHPYICPSNKSYSNLASHHRHSYVLDCSYHQKKQFRLKGLKNKVNSGANMSDHVSGTHIQISLNIMS